MQKTTKHERSLIRLVGYHQARSNTIFHSDLSTEQKLNILIELNFLVETQLMAENRYRGFRYAHSEYRSLLANGLPPGEDTYWKLLEQFREYY